MRSNRFSLLVLALLSVALQGCSTKLNPLNWFDGDEGEQPAELQQISEEVQLQRRWSVKIGNGQGGKYNELVPAVDGSRVFAASEDGDVVAVDVASGDIEWRVRTRETITGGVGAERGLVMVGTQNAEVIVFDQQDGREIWRAPVTSEVLSPPQTNGDIVVLQTVDDKLIALDADTGERRWIYEANLPVLTLRGTSKPVFVAGAVVAGFSNGTLVAVNAEDGIWRWEERVAVPQGRYDIDRVIDVDGDLLVDNNVVLATSYQGNLMGFDAQTGRIVWGMEASSYHGLAAGFGNLYLCDDRSHLIAIRRNSDNEVWRNEDLDLRELTAPTTFNNYIAVADFEGYVHLISQVDGRIVGRREIDSEGIRAPLVVGSNTLLAYGNSGRLTALTIQ
ncbi:MAG: outer membrane protein assembly factor BamB [Gammaproteobacteria bacterium]|nr:outer membrane protein assembly factor BamB [Pseudomonadales bacterium]MCP5346636.1 outer membrane protein assembly factor BamB [Pseudomonadales bacterium]